MSAKCNIRINKFKKLSSTIPKSSENLKQKDVNWKKIELRLNIFQNKIYALTEVFTRLPTYSSYMLCVTIKRYKKDFFKTVKNVRVFSVA